MDSAKRGVNLLRAQIAFVSRRGSDATALLLAAARELEAVGSSLARATGARLTRRRPTRAA